MESSTKNLRVALSKIRDEELSGLEQKAKLLSDNSTAVQIEIANLKQELSTLEGNPAKTVFEEITLDARKADLTQQIKFKEDFLAFLDSMTSDISNKYQVISDAKKAVVESATIDELYTEIKNEDNQETGAEQEDINKVG